jgi:hypothetical protein
MKNNILFCSATANDRFEEALCMFTTIKDIYPEAKCHFDAIFFTDEQVKYFEDLGVIVKRFDTKEDLPLLFSGTKDARRSISQKEMETIGYRANTEWNLMYASWRLYMLPRIMKEYDAPIMWLDTDCMVRKNIDEFLNKSLNYDFSVNLRNKLEERRQLLSAVFVVNNTPKGKKCLELMPQIYLELFEKAIWWADPWSINASRIRSKCETWNFSYGKYADNFLRGKSSIWHAKAAGVTKKVWINETKRFLKRYKL